MQLYAYTYSSKVSQCLVFCRDTSQSMGLFFINFSSVNLVLVIPNEKLQSQPCTPFSTWGYAQALYTHYFHFTLVYNTYFTSIHKILLHFQKTSLMTLLPHFPDWTYLDHLQEASQYITICTTCLPLLMVLVCKYHFVLKHQLSTWPTQHLVQKFPNASCFVRDTSPTIGLVFNQFPNLGTGGPKWNL